MKHYQEWLGALAAVFLILAIFNLPSEYYVFLRWMITAISVYVAIAFGDTSNNKIWLFVAIALVFNPIVPIYSTRSVWFFVDSVSAGIFLAYSKKSIVEGK